MIRILENIAGINLKEKRKEALLWAKDNLKDKKIIIESDNQKVYITNNGLKKTILRQSPFKNIELNFIKYLPELIKTSVYLDTTEIDLKQGIKCFIHYSNKVEYENKIHLVKLTFKKRKDVFFYNAMVVKECI